jgi:hypothetical protein
MWSALVSRMDRVFLILLKSRVKTINKHQHLLGRLETNQEILNKITKV